MHNTYIKMSRMCCVLSNIKEAFIFLMFSWDVYIILLKKVMWNDYKKVLSRYTREDNGYYM